MKNRVLLNIVLILSMIALAVFLWFKPASEAHPEQSISTLSKQAVTSIRIERPQQANIHLLKSDQQWTMLKPFPHAIRQEKAEQILGFVGASTQVQYSALDVNLAEFELDPSKVLSLQFNDDAKIQFGMIHPVSYERYILYGKVMGLLKEAVYGVLSSEVASFLDGSLVPLGRTLVKIDLPAPYDSTQTHIDIWKTAKAIEVLSWESENEPSLGKIQLYLDKNETLSYDILNSRDEWFLGNSKLKVKYQIPEDWVERLLPKS